ncbi:DUF1080 domain-containing protein [Muricauda sp. CAU 1633]|uniref:3-keto-disaccharide hydrolase n=1 Tax=Allomuricauda sp. CAU 1633 TaxID=2816036 RepID=UPI001A8F5CFE|nr:DUF1080 domain-containing protein [Muricauda sp. CAU 1633]MBO0323262.1 DUF1080 domain-containing protein [Muricauda sp. CAU 1633]
MHIKIFGLLCLTLIIISCKNQDKEEKTSEWHTKQVAQENESHNTLYDIEKEQGWELLFDGETLQGWHVYNSGAPSVWEVKEGALHRNPSIETESNEDLVSEKSYTNYELVLEWKIGNRGNSGIFINVQEKPEVATAYQTGPEYQILDPNHMDQDIPVKKSGCLYGFSPQENEAITNAGEWNQTRIKQENGKVEFYLNGVRTATQDFTAPEWHEKIKGTNFTNYPEFGKANQGKISLQDWYFEVWFRDIKIREL